MNLNVGPTPNSKSNFLTKLICIKISIHFLRKFFTVVKFFTKYLPGLKYIGDMRERVRQNQYKREGGQRERECVCVKCVKDTGERERFNCTFQQRLKEISKPCVKTPIDQEKIDPG